MTDPAAPVSPVGARVPDTTSVRRFPRQAFPADTVPRYRPVERPCNGPATGSSALGVAAVVLCWVPIVGVLCALLAFVLGGLGIARAKRSGVGARAAKIGLVAGVVSLLPAVVICVLVASA